MLHMLKEWEYAILKSWEWACVVTEADNIGPEVNNDSQLCTLCPAIKFHPVGCLV